MNYTVILLHGVETRSGNVNWPTQLESIWQAKNSLLRIKTRSYGGIWLNKAQAGLTLIPWVGWHYREKIVQDQTEYLDMVISHLGSGDKLSILGHSFAGWIVQRWLEMGYYFHKILLVAPAMCAKFDWRMHRRNFQQAYVFWSPTDEVIKWAWYGRMGRVGPKIRFQKVEDWEYKMQHSEWFNRENLPSFAGIWHELLMEDLKEEYTL